MSDALLILFLVMLGAALLCALRWPSLVVALGLATLGLEQLASPKVELFQTVPPAFNIIIALVIGCAFLGAVNKGKVAGALSGQGRVALTLAWGYVLVFWISSLWSPFEDYMGNVVLLAYFIVYVIMLPLLVGSIERTLYGYTLLWVILLVGCSGLLLSPYFSMATSLGRGGVTIDTASQSLELNPLAFSDTGVLLAALSVTVLFVGRAGSDWRIVNTLVARLLAAMGVMVGLWVAFVASRGETLTGLFCLMLIFVFLSGKRGLATGTVVVLVLGVMGSLVLCASGSWMAVLTNLSPRFAADSLQMGADIRLELISGALYEAFSSVSSLIVGIGARGCESLFGVYPHSAIVQALAETGILGLCLYLAGYFVTFRFGCRTLAFAQRQGNQLALQLTALTLCLLVYSFVVSNKKGSIADYEAHMWLVVSIMTFDRLTCSMINKAAREAWRRQSSFCPALASASAVKGDHAG